MTSFLTVVSGDAVCQSSHADICRFHKLSVPGSPPLKVPAHSTEVGENSPIIEHPLRYRGD